jgi:hypothetical protein
VRRLPVEEVVPVPAYTRRHVLAVRTATFGVTEEGYPPWPVQIPRSVYDMEPAEAIAFMFEYLAGKDRTDPPLHGSWVEKAERAIAEVQAQG